MGARNCSHSADVTGLAALSAVCFLSSSSKRALTRPGLSRLRSGSRSASLSEAPAVLALEKSGFTQE